MKNRYSIVVDYLSSILPDAESELQFRNPFELLVATMLSAQCTDKRVNMVTPKLFEAFPSAAEMSRAGGSDILPYIKSVSYPNSKAEHLAIMARELVEKFGGVVPQTMEELTQLPGVGRKTANVVMAVAFGKPAMPVDTHVFRVSHRLGLVTEKEDTPAKVEAVLTKNIPAEILSKAHHWFLLFGRYTCTARNPKCEGCGLKQICNFTRIRS